MAPLERFDVVIAGGGSAGACLAGRLSEDPARRVLLLEAGPADRNPLIRLPTGEVFTVGSGLDWRFSSEPEAALGGRAIALPRGRVLGGSSAINGQIYVRGHPLDFDEWAGLGADGWSFADALPYFRKAESWNGPDPDGVRGTDGPLATTRGRHWSPLYEAFVEAGRALGHPVNPDHNGARQDGFGPSQFTQSHRFPFRCSAANAYLAPARGRPNLVVRTGARVTGLTIERGRCTGLSYLKDGTVRQVAADGEVILSAGAYQSPQILMLSGIGPPEALAAAGVSCVHPLPGVGRNLQDHVGGFVQHRAREPVTWYALTRPAGLVSAVAQYVFRGRGPLTVFPMNAQGFVRSDGSLRRPDLQFYLFPLAIDLAGGSLYRPTCHGYGIHWAILRPRSRGAVTLASADPLAAPQIRHDYLSDPADRALNRVALSIARDLHAAAPFDRYRGEEMAPGADVQDPAAIDDYLSAVSDSHYHPVGTCRMGEDEEAVVDPTLRVRGLAGLRVVDASVMPRVPGGNTNAATIMIAERAADLVKNGIVKEPRHARVVA